MAPVRRREETEGDTVPQAPLQDSTASSRASTSMQDVRGFSVHLLKQHIRPGPPPCASPPPPPERSCSRQGTPEVLPWFVLPTAEPFESVLPETGFLCGADGSCKSLLKPQHAPAASPAPRPRLWGLPAASRGSPGMALVPRPRALRTRDLRLGDAEPHARLTHTSFRGPRTRKPGVLDAGVLSERTGNSVGAPVAKPPWTKAAAGPSLPLASAHL